MDEIHKLAGRNAAYLEQGIDLIERVGDPLFCGSPEAGTRGVGPHFRHIVDHYDSFFRGLGDGRVDYDQRERDTRLETDRAAIRSKLGELCARLDGLRSEEVLDSISVVMDCGHTEGDDRTWTGSTVLRELQFLVSHTVHHYAMIGEILGAEGVEMDPDFGVAPSTLRYENRKRLCAP